MVIRRQKTEYAVDTKERMTLRFTDGLTIDVRRCPKAIQARNHWTENGCLCPPGTPERKWMRR